MVELSKNNTAALVNHHQPNWRTEQYYSAESEDEPKKAFTGMVPIRSSGINMCVGMMNHVKLPHPFYFVFNVVNQPGTNKVEQEQACNKEQPFGQREEIQQPELILCNLIPGPDEQKCQCKINHDGGGGEEKVDARVFPFVVRKPEQWDCRFR